MVMIALLFRLGEGGGGMQGEGTWESRDTQVGGRKEKGGVGGWSERERVEGGRGREGGRREGEGGGREGGWL